MKKYLLVLLSLKFLFIPVFALDYFDYSDTVYTNEQREVLWDVNWDSIRSWIREVSWNVNWIINNNIDDSMTARAQMLWYVKRLLDYFLMFIATVSMIYLLYHWFLAVTAAWIDERYNKWIKWIKFAIIAIVWIWLSWMVISMIFWILTNVI